MTEEEFYSQQFCIARNDNHQKLFIANCPKCDSTTISYRQKTTICKACGAMIYTISFFNALLKIQRIEDIPYEQKGLQDALNSLEILEQKLIGLKEYMTERKESLI
jgi:hypothetical protein